MLCQYTTHLHNLVSLLRGIAAVNLCEKRTRVMLNEDATLYAG